MDLIAESSLVFRSKSQKRSRCFLDLFLFCLLGYVTYPPNPLSVKGAYGAESVVCTSDPKMPPVRGLGGVNIVREKCPRMRARLSFCVLQCVPYIHHRSIYTALSLYLSSVKCKVLRELVLSNCVKYTSSARPATPQLRCWAEFQLWRV